MKSNTFDTGGIIVCIVVMTSINIFTILKQYPTLPMTSVAGGMLLTLVEVYLLICFGNALTWIRNKVTKGEPDDTESG